MPARYIWPRALAGGVDMAKRANTKNEAPFAAALDRYFGLAQQGTDVRTEFIAGVTTFLTMVYIVFVNPIILGKAGMDQGAVFVATCVAAAVSTLVMALYPITQSRWRRAWASTPFSPLRWY